jgi:hypothetical protein
LWLAENKEVIEIAANEVEKVLGDPSYRMKYRIFDSFDGLTGTLGRTIQGTDGKLWFTTSKGLLWLDPANISTNALTPPVLIRSVKANDRQARSLTNLTLPPRTTNLQIDYTALSLSVPEKVRFRYRLQGVDKDWGLESRGSTSGLQHRARVVPDDLVPRALRARFCCPALGRLSNAYS